MNIIDCEQGSDEWFAARLGKVTASNLGAVLAKGRGKMRKQYMLRILTERLTGLTEPTFTNNYMDDGKETEAEAREYYEGLNDCEVKQIGFVELDDDIGCSPDGFVGKDGGLEIKCVKSTTHIETILSGKMPTIHTPQVQGSLWITGRKWWDWVSYDARVQDSPFFSVRVERDENYIKLLQNETALFLSDMKKLMEKVEVF